MVMALVVPVLANGLRAFGTIYAAHITSVEQATGYDHIVYGWIFFGLVMAAVLAIGWKWFDRDPRARWFDPAALQAVPRHRTGLLPGAALVLAVARSEEHTSELQSLMRISYAVFCLKKKTQTHKSMN